jgi:hypothetical protein
MATRKDRRRAGSRQGRSSSPRERYRKRDKCASVTSIAGKNAELREVFRTNNLVELSFALHVQREAGIEALVLDEHMSAVEGSIGVLPRRIMVENGYYDRARRELGNVSLTIDDS